MRRVVAHKRVALANRATAVAGLGGEDLQLFEGLKAWRGAEARSQAVPAYVVFHDSTLAEIARSRPRTIDELASIPGIGAKKLDKYASALLELVRGV